jgi:molybdopterin/thiamine biosynthesis adenylyltransferase/rhodanese-related sulfurtransferase
MPEVRIRIPAALRSHADDREELRFDSETLAGLLLQLTESEPLLASRLLADDGTQRPYVRLFLDGAEVDSRTHGSVPIAPDSVLTVVASIAGGRPGRGRSLTPDERFRYHRQLILPGFGEEGQARLREASVLLVGAGGLGSPAALYLAAAGVGRIGLVDADTVDLSNLHRQVLHGTDSLGRTKVESAAATLARLNPEIEAVPMALRLTSDNALDTIAGWDVVIDGSDNFPTRYLVNDACVLLGIPLAYGAVFRFEGQASLFGTPDGPCYRCLFRDPPPPGLVPGCEEAGVMGVLPGIIGTIQATETLKHLLGAGRSLAGRLLLVDAWEMEFREIEVRRDPECPLCGTEPTITELIDYEEFCGSRTPGAPSDASPRPSEAPADLPDLMQSASIDPGGVPEIDVAQLQAILDRGDRLQLVDVREEHEWEISNLGFAGAKLIPLGQLFDRLDELDPSENTVIYCRSGSRSAMAVKYLQAHGFARSVNLRGGINDWALQIDREMPRY